MFITCDLDHLGLLFSNKTPLKVPNTAKLLWHWDVALDLSPEALKTEKPGFWKTTTGRPFAEWFHDKIFTVNKSSKWDLNIKIDVSPHFEGFHINFKNSGSPSSSFKAFGVSSNSWCGKSRHLGYYRTTDTKHVKYKSFLHVAERKQYRSHISLTSWLACLENTWSLREAVCTGQQKGF